ncbi:dicarboxylate/amino acid:cation symporter [Stutzerimonas kunmingensis]|uniref:dicarboxylate/amino acid:cation symporter n=1 Tax=Stutzerimonas kunmingensis TaxID=1211807 RepID=UPI00241F4B73|nr:cation:dicarboxylase symporter family transporter [Stutzerimonas kunmingensis]
MTQSTTLSAPLRLLVRLPLSQQILIGLALGVAAGMAFGADAQLLAPIGTLFLNAIKMLIVPLVFVSLVAGITSMQDSAKLGRISLKTIAIYLVTTAFAVSIGLLFGALFTPGEGMNMVASGSEQAKQAPSLEGVALIAGIDRILDMARTTVNVAGDLMTTTLVGRSEQELDRAMYDASNKE